MKILDWTRPDEALSLHTGRILETLGWHEKYEKAEPKSSVLSAKTSGYDFHKWSLNRSQELLSLFPARPEKVQLLESSDGLCMRGKQLWPELILPAALKSAVRRRVKTLDLRLKAYIISQDIFLRPLASMAVGLGFSKICLVGDDEAYLISQKKFLERRLVGVSLELVLVRDLTLQPQNAGLLVNSLDLNAKKELLQDIAYFNFMTTQAIFIDLFEQGSHKILQEEAGRAQLTCIRSIEVEWSWWVEVGLRLQNPMIVSEEASVQFYQNLD